MIISYARVSEGVPRFKEQSFMTIGCSVNDFYIVKNQKRDDVCVRVEQSLNSSQKSDPNGSFMFGDSSFYSSSSLSVVNEVTA